VSRLVVDSSVTGAWCLQDEHNAAADQLLAMVAEHGGIVPALWPAEMANILVMAERRGRIGPADAERAVALLRRLPLAIEPADGETLGRARALAREYGLTAYDAWYLEVALRLALPLATFDTVLRTAAETAGVDLAIAS